MLASHTRNSLRLEPRKLLYAPKNGHNCFFKSHIVFDFGMQVILTSLEGCALVGKALFRNKVQLFKFPSLLKSAKISLQDFLPSDWPVKYRAP